MEITGVGVAIAVAPGRVVSIASSLSVGVGATVVVAAVVAREGRGLDFAAIEAGLRQRLSGYKVPRGWAQIAREDVPLLHSNKVARREIAAMMAQRLGREG